MTVFHSESLWDSPQLLETKSLVKISCMGICGNHCIELEYPESAPLALNKAVIHKLFADMIAAESLFHRKAGIADVSAPSHICLLYTSDAADER